MKYLLFVFLFFSSTLFSFAQSQKIRPAIGLTLSGGGAKGLAHIGILKAIDSAGLKISYVTGTSMGSIIGALYASGYPADTIEKMARKIDWDVLLSNSSSLRSLILEEKDEYDKYAVELPWVNDRFKLPSGVLESEELWLKFSEFFFPVYGIKDFSKLPKPFRCIATDISSGEAVVLDKGELTYAIRSSMAIPSVFTAVEYKGKKLVDGGLVRNFPVNDAKEMGADFIIGSSVAGELLPKEKITNVFKVLLQVALFREDEDTKKQKRLCDVFISQALNNYTMARFSSADEIIDTGILKGRSFYPVFKRIADSLNAIYGKEKVISNELPKANSVKITDYQINGLHKMKPAFFLHRMQFENNKRYTPDLLSHYIRNAFGSRYYNKIVYTLQPLPDSSAKIIFDVEENPLTFAKLGINYNSFTGISLIGNITTRNFLLPYSRSMLTVNIGENMRIKAEHLQFFGKRKTLSLTLKTQAESLSYNTYSNFTKDGVYSLGYLMADIKLQISLMRKLAFGAGIRSENQKYNPDITSKYELRGINSTINNYLSLHLNTLSNNIYPKKGAKIEAELGQIYPQETDMKLFVNGQQILNADSLGFNYGNFTRFTLHTQHYFPLTNKYTLFTDLQAGINLNQSKNILNSFSIGGLNSTYHNQITFAGLNEGSFNASSAACFQLGMRYQMYSNLFIIGRANGLIYNFTGNNNRAINTSFLSGYALTMGYNFVLGPLEISAMYSDQSKKILPYINLGIPF
jgi:NTE family protein